MLIPKHSNLLLLILLIVLLSTFSVSIAYFVPTPFVPSPGPFQGGWGGDYDPYKHPIFVCNPDDSAALYKIAEALGNTYFFTSWVPDSDCCNGLWDYIECDQNTGRVIKFVFNGLITYGGDPQSFPHLIPEEIRKLTALKSLTFANNASGVIPNWLANLKDLTLLDLSQNQFSGRISRCLIHLPNLRTLSLNHNQLSGRIPPFLSNLTSLESLSLSNNNLMGRIPADFLATYNGTGISLSLGYNNLGGPLPPTFAKVPIKALSVPNNNLSGDISFLFGRNKMLSSFDISHNKFRCDISKLEMRSDFTSFLLNNNILFGKLPQSLLDLASLNALNVSNNKLSGKIPQGGKLQTFDASAYVNNTRLCGAPLQPCA